MLVIIANVKLHNHATAKQPKLLTA